MEHYELYALGRIEFNASRSFQVHNAKNCILHSRYHKNAQHSFLDLLSSAVSSAFLRVEEAFESGYSTLLSESAEWAFKNKSLRRVLRTYHVKRQAGNALAPLGSRSRRREM